MRPNPRGIALFVVGGLVLAGCGGTRHVESPAAYAVELRIAPGFRIGDSSRLTIHPTASYERLVAGGVDGESGGYMTVGGQLRLAPNKCVGSLRCTWIGGEATVGKRNIKFDDPAESDENDGGFTLAALVGVPLVHGKLGTFHGYAALGYAKYGGGGSYTRLGIDWQPPFLRR